MTHRYFAQSTSDYDCNAYGAGSYNEEQVCGTDTSTGAGSSNPLANTGYDVIIPIALAAAVLIASAIMIVRQLAARRRSARPAA